MMSAPDMQIRLIKPDELGETLALVERVFMQFEAPDYSPQGVETFFAFLRNPEEIGKLTILGAFSEGSLVGVLATRGNSHIALFFVDAEFQRRGIGRALFSAARAACTGDSMSVNSSPYALAVYRRLGFEPLSEEQESDGIRFTPMKCRFLRARAKV